MAGYSGTPLPQKLGIKPGSRLGLSNGPAGFTEVLGPLPEGVCISSPASGCCDVIVSFVRTPAEVEAGFLALKPLLDWAGGLWIAWPKRTKTFTPEVSENQVRDIGLAAGLVDNKVCAVDEEWSGLRFVWRVADRPQTAKAKAGAAK
jgi:hypothetical protein